MDFQCYSKFVFIKSKVVVCDQVFVGYYALELIALSHVI